MGPLGEELGTTIVNLGPRMGLLDTLKEAQITFALTYGPYIVNPFEYSCKYFIFIETKP